MQQEYDFSKGKRGAVVPQKGKTRITIYLDNEVVDAFRTRAEKNRIGLPNYDQSGLKRAFK